MAANQVLGRWSSTRIRRARDTLIEVGILVVVHEGGRRPGDPSQYSIQIPRGPCPVTLGNESFPLKGIEQGEFTR